MQQRNRSWLVSIGIAALFAVPNATGRYQASIRPVVSFDIAVEKNINQPPALQIYYDQGKGFSEKHAIQVVLPAKAEVKKIQAHLPITRLHALRLDYLNGPGTVTIANLVITDPFGLVLAANFTPAQFIPHQTKSVEQQGGKFTVQTIQDADDPYVALPFQPALSAPTQGKIWPNLVFGLKIFFSISIAVEILFLIIGKSCINDWLRRKTPGCSSE
ncbi:MAG: hypothetical protein GX087_09475 [Desulfobulbaceae bacterium]|nr:hypothetical protein [Desulfobulbaceae bacterium]